MVSCEIDFISGKKVKLSLSGGSKLDKFIFGCMYLGDVWMDLSVNWHEFGAVMNLNLQVFRKCHSKCQKKIWK